MRTAVITPVAGRRTHLLRQQDGLRRSEQSADVRIIVAMDDAGVDAAAGEIVVRLASSGRLPLARARNQGAQAAADAGADLLIFLDVDCIPAPQMIARYCTVAQSFPDDLLCGPVHYLDPAGPRGYDLDLLPDPPLGHPARPTPTEDGIISGGDFALFWSLSFAVTTATWLHVGGFDECYEGYGGEDTDFAQRAKQGGGGLTWVGGAWAFHQHHPTSHPPVQHLDDILRNAGLFRDRWGWWPMQGWLNEFESLGLIRWDVVTQMWVRT